MNSIYTILNFSLIAIVLIIFIRYIWSMFFDDSYYPEAYRLAAKAGNISKSLLKSEKNYPDKVRFFNFWIQAERIKKHNVPGNIAELGVYKGETAKVLHQLFPDRLLFLYDTFEGFVEKDLKGETGEAATYTTKNFADTSIQKVLSKIDGNKNIMIRQGYFPDSVEEESEDQFAFVSMDADLHNPTRAGLEFFYPRMAKGGIILIHDYNEKWEGLKKAVDDYTASIPEPLILLPDVDSTVMIIKN